MLVNRVVVPEGVNLKNVPFPMAPPPLDVVYKLPSRPSAIAGHDRATVKEPEMAGRSTGGESYRGEMGKSLKAVDLAASQEGCWR